MKKIYYVLFALLIILPQILLTSCMSALESSLVGQKFTSMEADNATDASGYSDYTIKNFKFPDGKIADIYIFNNVKDQYGWFIAQRHSQDPEWHKLKNKDIADYKAEIQEIRSSDTYVELIDGKHIAFYNDMIKRARWSMNLKGPLTPFYKVYFSLVQQYGSQEKLIQEAKAIGQMPSISYYKVEELGELADYMTEKSAASACFEDSSGVYMLTLAPPKNMTALKGNSAEQKRHKGELAYEIAYIPRSQYPKITPPKLTPAKLTPTAPSSIPDSDRNLNPLSPTGTGAYYYDENLAYQLQWLAVKIACKGVYDMAYTGNFRAKNPTDYYKTSFIKSYLAKNDGSASKGTTLFEGICFDYADFAYQELSENRKNYSSRIKNFYMVGTFSNSTDIIAYRLAESGENYDMIINRTPVVVYAHNHIKAHSNATNHAWFWVVAADGVVYWVDPTWTDNSGRPVYGIVRGGQEMQLPAAQSLCVQ